MLIRQSNRFSNASLAEQADTSKRDAEEREDLEFLDGQIGAMIDKISDCYKVTKSDVIADFLDRFSDIRGEIGKRIAGLEF